MSEAIGLHELERIWETVSYCYGLKDFFESREADCANEGVDNLNLRSATLPIRSEGRALSAGICFGGFHACRLNTLSLISRRFTCRIRNRND